MAADLQSLIESGNKSLTSGFEAFIKKYSSAFQLPFPNKDRKSFCSWCLAKLSESPAPNPALFPLILNALRILTREQSGIEEILLSDSLKILLKLAQLCSVEEPQQLSQLDRDTIVEAIKCLFNIVLKNHALSAQCCEFGAIEGIALRFSVGVYQDILVYDMKLLFLLTSTHAPARAVFRDNHRGMTLLLRFVDGVIMSHTGLPKEDSMELIERVDVTLLSSELHKTELDFLTDTLKSIFNITLNWKEEGSYNEDDVKLWKCFAHLSRILLTSVEIKENEKAEQMIQCLCDANFNQPTSCAECFLSKPRLQEAGSPPDWVYDGFDVRPIIKLVALLDSRLPSSPPAVSMSIVGTLRNLSVGHRSIRRYLRATILPPLGRVTQRPDEGESLKSRLIRAIQASGFGFEDVISDFLFILCKENTRRYIKHVGYGRAAGLLMNRGLIQAPGMGPTDNRSLSYSADEDSDTEEYKSSVKEMDPVTGGPGKKMGPSPLEAMSPEEQEEEARKLEEALEKLHRRGHIKMLGVDSSGKVVTNDDKEGPSDSDGDQNN